MIVIVAPNPGWSIEFQAIGSRLRAALGAEALRIDHIGSTAVSGLAAKDIIDIQVTVSSFDGLLPALDRAGFRLKPGISQDHQPPGQSFPERELEKTPFQSCSGSFGQHSCPHPGTIQPAIPVALPRLPAIAPPGCQRLRGD